MTFLELTEGPLWYIAVTVFLLGVVWRLAGILMIGKPKDLSASRASSVSGAIKAILLHSVPHGGNLPRTVYHFLVGYGFHVGLFVLVLFAAPHVAFIEQRIIPVTGMKAIRAYCGRPAARVASISEQAASSSMTGAMVFASSDAAPRASWIIRNSLAAACMVSPSSAASVRAWTSRTSASDLTSEMNASGSRTAARIHAS